MAKDKFVILGPNHPVPLRALWLLLDSHDIPSDEDGFPLPGTESILRAHQAVARWFAEVNGPEDLSFLDDSTPIELHRDQARIGVCPFCYQNDGHQEEREVEYWGFCTKHRTRWRVEASKIGYMAYAAPPRPIGDFSVVEGVDLPIPAKATGTALPRVANFGRPEGDVGRNPAPSGDGADPHKKDDNSEGATPAAGGWCRRPCRGIVRTLVQAGKDVVLLLLLPFLILAEWGHELREWVRDHRDARRARPRLAAQR
jgi:hypothetical protein